MTKARFLPVEEESQLRTGAGGLEPGGPGLELAVAA